MSCESPDHIGVGVKITVFIMETRVFKWKIDHCTREVHRKLHPGLEYHIFHILSSEDIDDVISPHFSVCVQFVNGER